MKKFLSVLVVLCMVVSVWSSTVTAEENFLDFYEQIDTPIYYDLDGDGTEDCFSVDHYSNYFGRFVFNINKSSFMFSATRHGGYDKFMITDIDETDNFLDIIVLGIYKGAWLELYRYDGKTLYANESTLSVSTEKDFEKMFEYLETLSVTAGGGKLIVTCGPETLTYDKFSFAEADLFSEQEIMEDGNYNVYNIEVDGKEVTFDQCPVNKHDRLLVPVRAIFEEMGYGMVWDAETRTAHATNGENFISVQIGNKTIFYTIDGVSGEYQCDVAPMLVGDRTLIPLRGVAESAGGTAEWDTETGTARITTNR